MEANPTLKLRVDEASDANAVVAIAMAVSGDGDPIRSYILKSRTKAASGGDQASQI